MNTANLQIEGLLLAIAAVNRVLVEKGLVTIQELDQALSTSEQIALGDDRAMEDLSPANRDAIAFPIRLLRLANSIGVNTGMPGFAELAREVAATKGPHNDQV